MEISTASNSRPHVSFEVEKVIGISSDGNYRVQWAPAWVSKFHLVGCEHLIQEFIQQTAEKTLQCQQQQQQQQQQTTEPENQLEPPLSQVNYTPVTELEFEPLPPSMNGISSDACSYAAQNDQAQADVDDNEPVVESHIKTVVKSEYVEDEVMDSFESLPTFCEPLNAHLNQSSTSSKNTFSSTNMNTEAERDISNQKISNSLLLNSYDEECMQGGPMKTPESYLSTHTGSKSYFCSLCGFAAACRNTLTRHMRTHSSEKSFYCKVCGKSFASSHHLEEHLLIHNGRNNFDPETPFACKYCGKCFTARSYCKRHEATHSRDKPYACMYCDEKFIKNTALKAHLHQRHKALKPFACVTCGKRFKCTNGLDYHTVKCSSTIVTSVSQVRM